MLTPIAPVDQDPALAEAAQRLAEILIAQHEDGRPQHPEDEAFPAVKVLADAPPAP